MQILHLPNRHPLRLANPLPPHHHLLLLDGKLLQLFPQCCFDPLPNLHVVLRHHAHRVAGFTRASRSSDAVDVGFAVGGEVEVDDDIDGGDVETTGGDVGGNEDVAAAGTEFTESAEAGGLRELAVQGDSAEAEGAQEDCDSLCFVYGTGEDDGGLASELVEQVDEVEVLVLVGEEEVVLKQIGDSLVFVRGNGDAEGVGEGGALEGFNLRGHGCGEEVGVPFAREDFEDFVEDGAEVEVEEAVGFVHNEVF